MKESKNNVEFDNVSSHYEEILNKGLSLSGESPSYFAKKRVIHTANLLSSNAQNPQRIMDYGCGIGGSIQHLIDVLNPANIVAADTSKKSLHLLRRNYPSEKIEFLQVPEKTKKLCDLCFCNGVFHHIPPGQRDDAVSYIFDSLHSGGFLFFWENNPWSLATHWVMSRISFDRDAIKIFPHQATNLLKKRGFKVKIIHYLFIFPSLLRFFRPFEKLLVNLPIGCQYLIMAQKP